MPNVIIAAGMVIFTRNVLLHHDPLREVANTIVVVGILEDVEEVVEEDQRWSRRTTTASWSRSGHVRTTCTWTGNTAESKGTLTALS